MAVALRLNEAREGRPPSRGPQSVGIALTNACNLNCITCWSYSPLRKERPRLEWMRRHLTHEQLLPAFAEMQALGVERVIFTGGGDPLAHPEFHTICQSAKAHGLRVTLISNLTLVRDPEAFLELGIDTILANFSSADAESYVAFHPNRRAEDFPRLLGLLERVAATRTQLKLVFVVCNVNAHVLGETLRIAERLGASVQFKLMSVTEETQSLAISEAQKAILLQQRPTLEQTTAPHNLPTFYAELSGESVTAFPIEQVGCWAGHYYARITASSDVYFCCNQHPELHIGNLCEQSFRTLWQSERYQQVRERLRRGEFVSGCQQCGKFDLNVKVAERIRAQ